MHVAFLCQHSDGRYHPITESRVMIFGDQPFSPKSGVLPRVVHSDDRLSAFYTSFLLSVEGDPFGPTVTEDDEYSRDGYVPESVHGLGANFLACFAVSYRASMRAGMLSRDVRIVTDGPALRVDVPYDPDRPAQEPLGGLLVDFRRVVSRGIQVRGGAQSGWLPPILVLPIQVEIVPAESPPPRAPR